MNEVTQILQALHLLIGLAERHNVSVQQLIDMREASGGELTIEDLKTLSGEAHAAVDEI